MFNRFRWNSGTSSNKGINWYSWNNMSMAKNKGGLGFRNLYGFNIALLEKHCWNILHNPNTLVARLFKARYFLDCYLVKATLGQGSSFIWNGIWIAMEELKKRL